MQIRLKIKMSNSKDLLKSEFIGFEIEVMAAKNPSLIGLRGKVIDETKNTLIIKAKETEKRLLKKQITFKISGKLVKGEKISLRPEERIKK